jgi:ABC-type transport system involved in cytochrome bd biosynthesis fused ATPase/permease subunit
LTTWTGQILAKIDSNRVYFFSSHETAVAARCDKIVVLEQGKVMAEGDYRQLLDESARFVELLSRLDVQGSQGQ